MQSNKQYKKGSGSIELFKKQLQSCTKLKGHFSNTSLYLLHIPEESLVNISYLVHEEDITPWIYLPILQAYQDSARRKKVGMHKKKFEDVITILKKRIDYIAGLSDVSIRIELPKSIVDIKTELYFNIMNIVAYKHIETIFSIVFGTRVTKDELEKIRQEYYKNIEKDDEIEEMLDEIYEHNKSKMTERELKEFMNKTSEVLFKGNFYYTGNPN